MLDIWGIILTALLSALIGAFGGNWALNRKTATKTEVSYLREIIEELRKERDCDRIEIADLTSKVAGVKTELETEQGKRRTLESDVRLLEAQLEELEQTPRTRKKNNGIAKA